MAKIIYHPKHTRKPIPWAKQHKWLIASVSLNAALIILLIFYGIFGKLVC